MTLRTECDPLISRALAATKLNSVRYVHFLFLLLPETLKLLLYLLMFQALIFKRSLENCVLRLKNAILAFRLRKLIAHNRKALFKNFGRAVLVDELFDVSKQSHINGGIMKPNARRQARL